jgi:CheY-like chemotaxis protein
LIHKHLILIDDNSQCAILEQIKSVLQGDGINLIYQEYNPTSFQKRENGDVYFDREAFAEAVKSLAYIKQIDSIVCDYNLIEAVVNGFEIIQIIKEINPNYKKQTILYSADIKVVIKNIINKDEDIVTNLKQLIDCNIDFIKKEGYDQEVIRHIKKEKPFNFEDELIKWFYSRQNDEFNYLFPKYTGKKFIEIAQCLKSKTPESIEFKKELIEQFIAYLSKINGLE